MIDPFFTGLIGAGLGYFSAQSAADTSAQGMRDANRMSQESAREQMAFQERMSNSSHQREVEDLKKAGLNPILSANAGASTPSGAMGSFQNPNEAYEKMPDVTLNSAKIATDAYIQRENAKLIRENIKTQRTVQAMNSAKIATELQNARVTSASADMVEADAKHRKNISDIEQSTYGKGLNWVSYTTEKLGGAIAAALGLSKTGQIMRGTKKAAELTIEQPDWSDKSWSKG